MIDNYIKHLIKLVNLERNFEKHMMLDEIKNLAAKERERKGRTVNNLDGKFLKKTIRYVYSKIFKV